jgi:peroxiredoxin
MAIKVGDRIPKATLKRLTPEGMKDINTEEFFKGRKVVLFSVPGAFTPTLLADGNAEFTRALGLEFDGSGFGMGIRGQRFSAIVEDGIVKKLHVEAPGKFEVSKAEVILGDLS